MDIDRFPQRERAYTHILLIPFLLPISNARVHAKCARSDAQRVMDRLYDAISEAFFEPAFLVQRVTAFGTTEREITSPVGYILQLSTVLLLPRPSNPPNPYRFCPPVSTVSAAMPNYAV